MAIDFPNSPSVNATYTVGNRTWIYDGTSWNTYNTTSFSAETLPGTTLKSTVTGSSLTTVGTLNSLTVVNGLTATGGSTLTGGTVIATATAGQDSVTITGRAGGTSSYSATLTPTTLTANRTLTLPNATGTVARTADVGMRFITSGTFTAQSSISINNCFSSDYTNYRVVVGNITSSSTLVMRIRMRLSGTDNTTGAWNYAYPYLYDNGAAINISNAQSQTGLYVGDTNNTSNSLAAFSFDVYQPNLARRTIWLGTAINYYNTFFTFSGGGTHNVETAYDGFTLYTDTGNITGNYQVYGYTI